MGEELPLIVRILPSLPILRTLMRSTSDSQLFGEDEDAAGQGELDAAEKDGENGMILAQSRYISPLRELQPRRLPNSA